MQNPYDHALKILARNWPEQFLQLGVPNQPIRLLGTISNVELALEIDRVDFLHEIEIDNERAFFHIDFQLEHEEDCKRRFFVYNGMLTELEKPTPIITVPIYLRPRISDPPDRYEVKLGGIVFHTFTYKPIVLSRYVEQIRSGELYMLAPLLPILTQPMNETTLIEERQLILTNEPNPVRQNTLLTTAILIAAQSKLFTSDFLWELFKEDSMDINDPVISKLFDRFYGQKLAKEVEEKVAKEVEEKVAVEVKVISQRLEQESKQQRINAERAQLEAEVARRQAEVEAEATHQWQELILKFLEYRYQSIPVALVLLLQHVPANQRSRVSDLILDSPDVTQCLQAIRELLGRKQG